MIRFIYALIFLSLLSCCHSSKAQAQRKIISAEYFWGTIDPGTGNGSPVFAIDGNLDQSLEKLYANGLFPPAQGANLFNIRVKDQDGNWGPLYKSVIIVEGSPTVISFAQRFITAAEYFWGTIDPGSGYGNPILASDGNLDQSLEQLYANGLTAPSQVQNLFNIRVKDKEGKWGPLYKSIVNVEGQILISPFPKRYLTDAEYFWGTTDPGSGNGTPILAVDGNLDQSLEQLYAIGITAPSQGQNLFNIRVKDQDGKWGPLYKSIVRVEGQDPILPFPKRYITAAEFFWGTSDPGAGNGTPILATDGNLDQSLEQLYANGLNVPLNGQNLFNIRVKDQDGRWGPIFKSVVRVNSLDPLPTFPKKLITAAEYFWGTSDPGTGNGTPILAVDGNLDQSLEQLFANGLYAPSLGQNLFNIRVKDQDGNWGPIFRSIVSVGGQDPVPSYTKRVVTTAEYFWANNDPGEGNATPLSVSDGHFNESLEEMHLQVNNLPANGMHLLKVRVRDQDNNWGPIFAQVLNIAAPSNEFGVYSSPEYINRCKSDSAQLFAYGASSYEWFPALGLSSTNGNYVKAAPDTITTYTVIGTNGIGDRDTAHVTVFANYCAFNMTIKVFIEGFYLGNNMMNATVNSVNYPTLCDTMIMELAQPNYPYDILYIDKSVIDINGNGIFHFTTTPDYDRYYLILRHRNAIETWSSSPVPVKDLLSDYHFNTSINQAYGNNLADLGDGNFALFSGDIIDATTSTVGRQDGVVESSDYGEMENAVYFTYLGYMPQDISGDGVVESSDYVLEENNVYYIIFSMHP